MPSSAVTCHGMLGGDSDCAELSLGRGLTYLMEKIAWDGPKWGREDFFPTNPDLANILGRTDLHFENLYFSNFLDLDFQVPRVP